jgi:hypothetical protein
MGDPEEVLAVVLGLKVGGSDRLSATLSQPNGERLPVAVHHRSDAPREHRQPFPLVFTAVA